MLVAIRLDRPGDKVKSITITYEIPSGTQLLYHENPGTCYTGTTRVAYLPDSPEGRQLLTRLKYAWTHGLIFRVGTSLTTGAHNVVTWASIHHKTSLSKSAHGFPDPNYFDNCNGALDALFVPDADTCWYQQS
jgi:deltex-like protein